MITLIAARSRNGVIGKDGQIPWKLPSDLALFARETTGGAIIMGRKTWQSLPRKPLAGRLNIVVSSGLAEGAAEIVPDVREALKIATDAGFLRVYGIGGAGIYREMLPLADRLVLTDVDIHVEEGDAFFPEFREHDWCQVQTLDRSGDTQPHIVRDLLRRDGPPADRERKT